MVHKIFQLRANKHGLEATADQINVITELLPTE